MRILILSGILMAAFAAPVEAQDTSDHWSKAYQDCITYGEVHNTTAIDPDTCNEAELKVQDARLNQAYKMVMVRIPAPQRTTLRDSQRQWINTRDNKCEAGKGAENMECLTNETYKRRTFLEQYH